MSRDAAQPNVIGAGQTSAASSNGVWPGWSPGAGRPGIRPLLALRGPGSRAVRRL